MSWGHRERGSWRGEGEKEVDKEDVVGGKGERGDTWVREGELGDDKGY